MGGKDSNNLQIKTRQKEISNGGAPPMDESTSTSTSMSCQYRVTLIPRGDTAPLSAPLISSPLRPGQHLGAAEFSRAASR